jgi:hypothetical protein
VAPGLGSRLAAAGERLRVEAVIGALVLMGWWARLRTSWWQGQGQRQAQGQPALAGVH